jgi:type II secretory pathway pseudopilin PulG
MFCKACGHPNRDDAQFCSKCGAAMAAGAAAGTRGAEKIEPVLGDLPGLRPGPLSSNDLTEEAWKAVIGPKNQAYYMDRFTRLHAGGGSFRASWHWPAFFVTWFWLLYRKLWGWSIFYYFFPGLAALAVGLAAGLLGSDDPGGWGLASYLLAMFILPPVLANWLYYRKCMKLVHTQEAGASRDKHLARLEARGGTSNVAVIAVGILAVTALIGMLAAIALPAYQDYTRRARVTQAINSGMAMAQRVGEQYEQTGRIPNSLDALRPEPLPDGVKGMKLDMQSGRIEIVTSYGPAGASGSIYLVPSTDANRHTTWVCKADSNITKYVPRSCRSDE